VNRALNVVVLGASGSIGRQALTVMDRYPDRFRVFGLVTGTSPAGRQAPHVIRAAEPGAEERLEELVTHPECDLVLVAISGSRALKPTLAALAAHKLVALATKEVLVMAGEMVMRLAGHGQLRPVDSEHSAIWQCLWGESLASVRRLVLTASGGPFWARPDLNLRTVTIEQALAHPRWAMGPKITVDSATLMNKGLELIEAHHLFQVPLERIDVLVHPQSTVHSMVEFIDGSIKAQLGNPDMRLPIAIALAYPDRLPDVVPATALEKAEPLAFQALDLDRFPSVKLAREAALAGPPFPAVLNAANEEAVQGFLGGAVSFPEIIRLVEAALARHSGRGDSLEAILAADSSAREYVRSQMGINLKS
jgi:1-deoxy-D-xylulose-5-phosphate reductoisomerase